MSGSVVVGIVWWLDLQLPMQSVPITIKVVSLNPAQARCTRYTIMCKEVCLWEVGGIFHQSINADRLNIAEVLLKVALNTLFRNIPTFYDKMIVMYMKIAFKKCVATTIWTKALLIYHGSIPLLADYYSLWVSSVQLSVFWHWFGLFNIYIIDIDSS
jgi:hypothetical protein